MQKNSCLLSYSLDDSTRRKVGLTRYIRDPIFGEREVVGGQQWYHMKER